jgi:RNA polymerase sigma-70 factor (ECF subfamily)
VPTDPVEAESDAVLVRSAWRGDGGARAAIWLKYSGLVRSKMRRAIGERDVEDHVQDVFVGLYENLSQLRDPAALRGFLLGIALRIAGTELRRRTHRWWPALTITGDLPEAPISGPDAHDAREILRAFLGVVGRLGPSGSRVFGLRYIEKLEMKQVAQAMDASLATTKRRLNRASARFVAMAERDPVLSEFLPSSPPSRRRGPGGYPLLAHAEAGVRGQTHVLQVTRIGGARPVDAGRSRRIA